MPRSRASCSSSCRWSLFCLSLSSLLATPFFSSSVSPRTFCMRCVVIYKYASVSTVCA